MRHLIFILLNLMILNSFGQKSITFYQKVTTDRLLDVYIDELNNQYEIIGEVKVSLEKGYFVYLINNSEGKLVQTIDLSYIYDHGFSGHHWDGGAKFIDGKKFTLSYQVKLPPPVSHYNCFINDDKSIIWRNKPGLIAKIQDSSYVGVNQDDDGSIVLCNVDFYGNTAWNLSYDTIFKLKITNSEIHLIDTIVTIIGRKRINDKFKLYKATINISGIIEKLDSLVYHDDSLHVYNSLVTRESFLVSGIYEEDNLSNQRIQIIDESKSILLDKKWKQDYKVNLTAMAIDSIDNYHILLSHNLAINDTAGVFEFYKISSKGKVLKHQFMYFVDTNLYFHKIVPLSDGGYFLLGGLMQSDNPLTTTGVIIKTDSNFYAEGGTYAYNGIKKESINQILVYPNPVKDFAIFNSQNQSNVGMKFQLFSISGKLVWQEVFNGNRFTFNRKNLPPGIYIYHISNNEHHYTGKLIFE